MPEPVGHRRRVTISDIARRAGVSKGAVSYALNGRPGLSDDTRRRILEIAEQLGWYPNMAARALSAARAGACGFVLARPAKMLALEPFFMEFLAGVEAELSARSIALTIQLSDDIEHEVGVYRRWWAERRVDGVLMVDPRVDDPRVEELTRLGLPAVVVGGPLDDERIPSIWHDEPGAVAEVVRYLLGLGHTRIARVAGVSSFLHTVRRNEAYRRCMAELSLPSVIVETDFSPESGAEATRELLRAPEPPTAILYDSDVLAVTGLGVAQRLGFVVPRDLSVVAWDDSLLARVVHPPLTAVTRDVSEYGAAVARGLLELIEHGAVTNAQTPRGELVARGSTAPPGAETGD